jgi:Icc protein
MSAPIRLLQLTDLHLFGSAERTLRGTPCLPAAEAVLQHATRRHAPWDGLLLTGDIVNDDPAGYAHVRRLLGTSPAPVHCLPGNHDLPAVMQAELADPPFSYCGSGRFGAWLVVMLDSSVPGDAAGALSATELARLDRTLAQASDAHALVCLHHHPVASDSRWLDSVGLRNPQALFQVLDRHPHVRAVVWGHVHQAFDGTRRGVRLLGTPSTGVQFKPRADDFATDDLPPGYRWLDLHADGRLQTGIEWVTAAARAPRQPQASAG